MYGSIHSPCTAAGRGLSAEKHSKVLWSRQPVMRLHKRFEVPRVHSFRKPCFYVLKEELNHCIKPFVCVYAEMLQWKCSDPEKLKYSFFLTCFCRAIKLQIIPCCMSERLSKRVKIGQEEFTGTGPLSVQNDPSLKMGSCCTFTSSITSLIVLTFRSSAVTRNAALSDPLRSIIMVVPPEC